MITYLKFGAAAALAFAVWYATSDHYQKRIAEIQLETAQAVQEQLVEDARKLKEATEQHDQDQVTISNLHRDAARLRVRIPVCSCAQGNAEDQNGGAGVFSERVDEAMADFKREVDALFFRCDQLNIDAIKFNNAQ